jgi:hypothetical protein
MARDNTFIAANTDPTSKVFRIKSGERNEVRISADDLVAAEVVDIQVLQGPEDTGTFIDSGDQLTATAPATIVSGPGVYKLAKGATVSACAVFLDL